jgi:ABC-type multidrug transport system ATPase subunit
VLIAKGKVAADGTLDELRARVGAGVRFRIELGAPDLDAAAVATKVASLPQVERVSPIGLSEGLHLLEVRAPADPRTAIARLALDERWTLRAMERHQPSLEEAFLTIVGQER